MHSKRTQRRTCKSIHNTCTESVRWTKVLCDILLQNIWPLKIPKANIASFNLKSLVPLIQYIMLILMTDQEIERYRPTGKSLKLTTEGFKVITVSFPKRILWHSYLLDDWCLTWNERLVIMEMGVIVMRELWLSMNNYTKLPIDTAVISITCHSEDIMMALIIIKECIMHHFTSVGFALSHRLSTCSNSLYVLLKNKYCKYPQSKNSVQRQFVL